MQQRFPLMLTCVELLGYPWC